MASPPRISELKHTVFMSYAHNDDRSWNWFVSNFDLELNRGIQSRLSDLKLPPTYFDKVNGPINGPLSDALKRAIEGSFAMMIFVHDSYVDSKWCLKEIEYFKSHFKDHGFERRLFIVAMSENAITALMETPAWKRLSPNDELVWIPFFKEEGENDIPMDIYLRQTRGREAVVQSDFWGEFVKLREALVREFRQASVDELIRSSNSSEYAASKSAAEINALESLIYIEGEPGQERYWESLGNQVAVMWDTVVALEPKEPRLFLRPTGLPMHNLKDRPRLDNADGVILLWGDKAPESLLAQIAMVEPKLQGPRVAPGLIAYLMEVGETPRVQVPETLQNWPVVRFAVRQQDEVGSATVLAEDVDKLAVYLRDVLACKRFEHHPDSDSLKP